MQSGESKVIDVTRVQYPVGQGCFHAGSIDWCRNSRQGKFRYVYDCGSQVSDFKRKSALKESIDAYASGTRMIDALFVSHLDKDHVSGLDHLLNTVPVHTVFISHLDLAARAADLVPAEIAGALSDSVVEASLNPEGWFGDRGVFRIVRVRPADTGEDFDPDAAVDDPPDGDAPQYAKISWDERDGEKGSGPLVRELMDSGRMVAPGRGAEVLNWVLVPHVDPVARDKLARFHKEVAKTLGLQDIGQLTTERLIKALQDKDKLENGKRKQGECSQLRKCYEGCFGRNHNRVSMSVYSGPRYKKGIFRRHLHGSDNIDDEQLIYWMLRGKKIQLHGLARAIPT